MGLALEPVRDRILAVLHINPECMFYKAFQTVKMLIIIFTGEMFFRGDGFRQGFHMFKSIFQGFATETFKDGTLLTLGLDQNDFRIIIIGCMIVFFADLIKEYWPKETKMCQKQWICTVEKAFVSGKWVICYGLVMAILIFGAYGEGYQMIDLIYAGF